MSELSSVSGNLIYELKVPGIEQVYPVHNLTVDDIAELENWINAQFPDPFPTVSKAIKSGAFTVPQQEFMLRQALEKATSPRYSLGMPEADKLVTTMAGAKALLAIAIRKGRPETTDEEIRNIYMHMDLGQFQAVLAVTGVAMLMSDPKALQTSENSTGNTTSPRRNGKGTRGGNYTTVS